MHNLTLSNNLCMNFDVLLKHFEKCSLFLLRDSKNKKDFKMFFKQSTISSSNRPFLEGLYVTIRIIQLLEKVFIEEKKLENLYVRITFYLRIWKSGSSKDWALRAGLRLINYETGTETYNSEGRFPKLFLLYTKSSIIIIVLALLYVHKIHGIVIITIKV